MARGDGFSTLLSTLSINLKSQGGDDYHTYVALVYMVRYFFPQSLALKLKLEIVCKYCWNICNRLEFILGSVDRRPCCVAHCIILCLFLFHSHFLQTLDKFSICNFPKIAISFVPSPRWRKSADLLSPAIFPTHTLLLQKLRKGSKDYAEPLEPLELSNIWW